MHISFSSLSITFLTYFHWWSCPILPRSVLPYSLLLFKPIFASAFRAKSKLISAPSCEGSSNKEILNTLHRSYSHSGIQLLGTSILPHICIVAHFNKKHPSVMTVGMNYLSAGSYILGLPSYLVVHYMVLSPVFNPKHFCISLFGLSPPKYRPLGLQTSIIR